MLQHNRTRSLIVWFFPGLLLACLAILLPGPASASQPMQATPVDSEQPLETLDEGELAIAATTPIVTFEGTPW